MKFDIEEYSAEITHLDRDAWTAIIRKFSDANIYQTYEYGEMRWGEDKLIHCIVKDKNDNIVSAVQGCILPMVIIKKSIIYIDRGPLWKLKNDNVEILYFKLCIKSIRNSIFK